MLAAESSSVGMHAEGHEDKADMDFLLAYHLTMRTWVIWVLYISGQERSAAKPGRAAGSSCINY